MAEYIKRETLVHRLKSPYLFNITQRIFEIISEIPAADVAPVVRCKGCKNSCKDGTGRTCEGYWYELSEFAVSVEDDDFCSYGERKPSADG